MDNQLETWRDICLELRHDHKDTFASHMSHDWAGDFVSAAISCSVIWREEFPSQRAKLRVENYILTHGQFFSHISIYRLFRKKKSFCTSFMKTRELLWRACTSDTAIGASPTWAAPCHAVTGCRDVWRVAVKETKLGTLFYIYSYCLHCTTWTS